MADEYLDALSVCLHLENGESFKHALSQLIRTIVKEKSKTIKAKLRSAVWGVTQATEDSKEQLESRFETLRVGMKDVQETIGMLQADRQRQESSLGNRLKLVNDSDARIGQFEQDIESLKSSLIQLSSDVSMKAPATDVNRIQEKLNSCCPMLYAEKLELGLRSKAELFDFGVVKKDVEDMQKELSEKCARKVEVVNSFRAMDEKIENSLRLYVTSQYFNRVNLESQKNYDLLRTKLDESVGDLRRKFALFRDDYEKIRKDLDNKVSMALFNDLKRTVAYCALGSQVEALNVDMLDCKEVIRKFRAELKVGLDAQDKVLQRYDEILLDKASKVDIMEMDRRVSEVSRHIDFEHRVDDIEDKVTAYLVLSKKQTEQCKVLSEQVETVSKTMKNVKSEKRDIAILKNTLQDLLEIVATKADKSQISELMDSKAPAAEVHRISKALGVMYRVDKLTIVLLQHTIKYINGTGDLKALEFGSAEWLLKHAEMVASWANVYEPIENEVDLPIDLMQIAKSTRSLSGRTGTAAASRSPTTAALSLLTPTRKSTRPVTPTTLGSGKVSIPQGSSRRMIKSIQVKPPSLDHSLFH